VSDKGIIFSAPMVRALLAGRKTQTRRLLNPQPPTVEAVRSLSGSGYHWFARKPDDRKWSVAGPVWAVRPLTGEHLPKLNVPYAVGDRLYVREAHSIRGVFTDVVEVGYRASENASHTEFVEQIPVALAAGAKVTWPRYRPSIHMPRWASRITLPATGVRVQRLQDISEADAIAEGLEWVVPGMWSVAPNLPIIGYDPRKVYSELWDTLHTKAGERWGDNPWIVAVTFDVDLRNIDAVRS
jgi:hypothetical protein